MGMQSDNKPQSENVGNFPIFHSEYIAEERGINIFTFRKSPPVIRMFNSAVRSNKTFNQLLPLSGPQEGQKFYSEDLTSTPLPFAL
jgi:hypothetical protein